MKSKYMSLEEMEKKGIVNKREAENFRLDGMSYLIKFDIEKLLKRQAMLDKKFNKKETVRERTQLRTYIAYFTELGELTQELKDEKNSTKKIDQKKVLEELSDVLHFYLSFVNHNILRNKGYKDMNFWKKQLSDFELAIAVLTRIREETENKIIGAMMSIVKHVGATEEEFLKIHHQVWLRNMKERTEEEY